MIEKNTLKLLYLDRGLSMSEIGKELHVSPNTVVWWMDKHDIPRRTLSQAIYLQKNGLIDPFKIKELVTPQDFILYGIGVGLYWGEGTKRNLGSVRLGNTDPELIKCFVEFLKDICGVKDQKIRFGLQVFNDINPKKALEYWMRTLSITRSNFLPTVVVSPSQGRGTYNRKSQYGVLTVYVNNVKLRNWLNKQLICPSSSVVERIHGGTHQSPPTVKEI